MSMSLRTLTRSSALGALVFATAGAAAMVVGPPASALAQPRITIGKDQVVERSYPQIAGNNPEAILGGNSTYGPTVCNTSAYCDTIPLTVELPKNMTADDEYFLQVTLSWTTEELPLTALEPGGYAANDMDMFIYLDPETDKTRTTEADAPYHTHAASGGQPEIAYMFKPKGKYSIVVVNFAGVNQGYNLKVLWVSEKFPTPFEDLGPDFSRPPAAPAPHVIGAPAPTTPPAMAPTVAKPAEPLVLPPAELGADADFGNFEFGDGSDDLSAPKPKYAIQPAAAVNPDPPSTLAVILWLIALPLALVALFGTIVLRRSAAIFPPD